jgi:hypothetical protein
MGGGIEFEENGAITGYIKINSDKTKYVVKAPNNINEETILAYNISPASGNIAQSMVLRNNSGDFSANIITANMIGCSTTATNLLNNRNIMITGDLSGNGIFNSNSTITIDTSFNNNIITTSKFTTNAITTNKIADNTLTGDKFLDNSITSSK